eukprot:TRINITY_DN6942_c0_g2_i2.p1 TRINITY_DN6942_c0_g2~~TRINITY_DN6942_c0_g2_i2.p1  ORF type:complete len:267 (-),score=25.31 TRINITY_DN6942_c0_g2_i2:13-813(-)
MQNNELVKYVNTNALFTTANVDFVDRVPGRSRKYKIPGDHFTGNHCKNHECGEPLQRTTLQPYEPIPEYVIGPALYHITQADLCIVLGTSLRTKPVSHFPEFTMKKKGKVVVVDENPYHKYSKTEDVIFINLSVQKFLVELSSRIDGFPKIEEEYVEDIVLKYSNKKFIWINHHDGSEGKEIEHQQWGDEPRANISFKSIRDENKDDDYSYSYLMSCCDNEVAQTVDLIDNAYYKLRLTLQRIDGRIPDIEINFVRTAKTLEEVSL